MNAMLPPRTFLLILTFCAACGGGNEVDISTIKNESAHEVAEQVEHEAEQANEALDSLPSEVADSIRTEQKERQRIVQDMLKRSPYAAMSDAALDSMRNAWFRAYVRSCDPVEFKRILARLGKDHVLRQWGTNNPDSAHAYWDRLQAAKKACGHK